MPRKPSIITLLDFQPCILAKLMWLLLWVWFYGKLLVSFNVWILVMAGSVSGFWYAHTFFVWKNPILSHFLNLKTPTEDIRLRHWRDYWDFSSTCTSSIINNNKKLLSWDKWTIEQSKILESKSPAQTIACSYQPSDKKTIWNNFQKKIWPSENRSHWKCPGGL
jgi:hypothetical protein